ncbi:monovalent cation/H(+) antiporter subunit G [Myxococcota bacterium]|nr:monovalent cation/H(+) antiporter subunit G [Myxococcota bacterium]
MRDVITIVLVVVGVVALVGGGVGLVRFGDALARSHAVSLAGAVGCTSVLAAAAVSAGIDGAVPASLAALVVLFTGPLAGQVIGHAIAEDQGTRSFTLVHGGRDAGGARAGRDDHADVRRAS